MPIPNWKCKDCTRQYESKTLAEKCEIKHEDFLMLLNANLLKRVVELRGVTIDEGKNETAVSRFTAIGIIPSEVTLLHEYPKSEKSSIHFVVNLLSLCNGELGVLKISAEFENEDKLQHDLQWKDQSHFIVKWLSGSFINRFGGNIKDCRVEEMILQIANKDHIDAYIELESRARQAIASMVAE